MTIKLFDGSYINSDHVLRYFVDEDVTKAIDSFAIKASINGPQMPYVVGWHESRQAAQEALDTLAYRIDNNLLLNV